MKIILIFTTLLVIAGCYTSETELSPKESAKSKWKYEINYTVMLSARAGEHYRLGGLPGHWVTIIDRGVSNANNSVLVYKIKEASKARSWIKETFFEGPSYPPVSKKKKIVQYQKSLPVNSKPRKYNGSRYLR